jgi:hypothetical protein
MDESIAPVARIAEARLEGTPEKEVNVSITSLNLGLVILNLSSNPE